MVATASLEAPEPKAEDAQIESQSIHDVENKKVPWPDEVWKTIHRAVHDEMMRASAGAQFLPHHIVHPKTMSISPDTIVDAQLDATLPGGTAASGGSSAALPPLTLSIDEGQTIRLNEIWTEFALTTQQVHDASEAKNPEFTSAVTLARRAAQYLALAQDAVIFQGQVGYSSPFFQQFVRSRPGQIPMDSGLLSIMPAATPAPPAATPPYYTPANYPFPSQGPFASSNPTILVPRASTSGTAGGPIWGDEIFAAATTAYSMLQSQGQSGPYALILHTVPYADLFAPVGTESLVITADRVSPLMKAGLWSTGMLPPTAAPASASASSGSSNFTSPASPGNSPYYAGVVCAVGGGTVDLVVGLHARTVFLQQDVGQNWRFRILTRFALRVTDTSATVPLIFL